MSLSVEAVKGPLSEEIIKTVSDLYGKFDSRFADFDYCLNKFNKNPYGYSYHSFAYDGKKIIGHCSVIPVKIIKDGREMKSGKSEAMILDQKYRKSAVFDGSKDTPLLSGMVMSLYNAAMIDGVDPIHAISMNPGVCLINKLSGFKKISMSEKMYLNIISHKSMEETAENAFQKISIKILFALNIMSDKLNSWKNSITNVSTGNIRYSENEPEEALYTKEYTENQWGISLDPKTVSWFFKSGRLINLEFEDNKKRIILWKSTKPENSIWIVYWNVADLNLYSGIFEYILYLAKKKKVSCVVFPEFSMPYYKSQKNKVMSCLKRYLFPGKKMNFDIYIKSKDSDFIRSKNIDFNSFFLSL
ncbi:hypothetical protein JXL83_04455 [candidate division WOR-3 bacterium]|nr:hypothetical protein [candidate division WOR-3 bacterium]